MLWRKMIPYLLLCIFLFQTINANGLGGVPPPPKKWMTLNGGPPQIVARGGYSGFFPDSSQAAYDFALDSSIPGTILYCNLHFTKDNEGICLPEINLQNVTQIDLFDPKGKKTYDVNGHDVSGWFSVDYTTDVIFNNVTLRQNIYKRQTVFDGQYIIGPLDMLLDKNKKPTRLWLNIEYDLFYKQHKISAEVYLFEILKVLPEFISSPEIGFLKAIKPKLGSAKTNLIFTFLGQNLVEPTTKTTYGALAKNLAMIKTFASGILVPKEYIWPMDNNRMLLPATTLVQDAHKLGLSVFASDFANDNYLSYNYSYDPAREYLQFIDNSQFSVDGVLTDFPSTASEAIGCLNQDKNAIRVTKTLIISHSGASGDFPGASDLAYLKAVEDGADIIDCSVQMSQDGIAFCSDRADLMKTTTAASLYLDRATPIPENQMLEGIFSYNLKWSEIQSLKPQMESFFGNELVRNPANMNSGKIVTLFEFLELAKTKAVPGVLISIQNAAYLASNRSLDIVGAVSSALRNASFDKQSQQRVLIKSDDSSVLLKFKDFPKYERVLHLEKSPGDAPGPVAQEVKKYADAVFVHRDAVVVADDQNFAVNFTNTIPALHAANVSVYVGYLKNEFENFIFDYLSDPYVELTTLNSLHVDGVMTDYPATANMFARSSCTVDKSAYVVKPVQPGVWYQAEGPVAQPPALATADVIDPPLPDVASKDPPLSDVASKNPAAPAPATHSSSSRTATTQGLLFAVMVALLTIYA